MSEVSASNEVPEDLNVEKPGVKSSDAAEARDENFDDNKLDNDDVQRAIDGLADIPDDKLQEFLNDKDFIEGLDVVDAWEGGTDKSPSSSKGTRTKDHEHTKSSR